jgi:hypothetical protein
MTAFCICGLNTVTDAVSGEDLKPLLDHVSNISRLKASTPCGSSTFYSPEFRFPSTSQESGTLIPDANRGPFRLYYRDLGNLNFLVDDDYNILVLIDWEGTCTLPSEYSAVRPMSLRVLPKVFWRGSRSKTYGRSKVLPTRKHQVFKDTVLAVATRNGQSGGFYLEVLRPTRLTICV